MLSTRLTCALSAAVTLGLLLACGGSSVRTNSSSPRIYAGGFQTIQSPFVAPGYWADGTWVGLPMPAGGSGWVNAMAVSGNEVYAAGWNFSDEGEQTGYWRNGAWVSLTPPTGTVGDNITALVVAGRDVFVAGTRRNASNPVESFPGYWLSGAWNGLPQPAGAEGTLSSLVVSGGNVYAGGSYSLGSYTNVPGLWRNGTWEELPRPAGAFAGVVNALAVSGGDVYAAGNSQVKINGLIRYHPGYWLNGTWVALAPPPGSDEGVVSSIAVSGADVYAAGEVTDSAHPEVSHPGYWLNGSWVGLTTPSGFPSGGVASLTVASDGVYAGGRVEVAIHPGPPSPSVSGYWRNGTWVGLSQPTAPGMAFVHSLIVSR